MIKNKKINLLAIALVVIALSTATVALAQTNAGASGTNQGFGYGRAMMGTRSQRAPGIFGTVASVSGNTLTVNSKARTKSTTTATSTVYTVDASNATVTKNGTTSSVANIVVGDMVAVQGTTTGTNVTATTIRDGVMNKPNQNPAVNPTVTGNGEPVVLGTVTSISGNTIDINNKSNASYVVDATSAKILVGNQASSISNITVGDNVLVQGTVNGASITASTIIDQKPIASTSTSTGTGTANPNPHPGFFGAIGGFFAHLFGF